MIDGRIGRFLRAARTLMWMQLGAAVIAVALAVWAVVAVRDLAAERDRLQERVTQLESRPAAAAAAPPLDAVPPDTNIAAPADLSPTPTPTPVDTLTNGAAAAPDPGVGTPQPLPPPPVRVPPPPTPAPTPTQTPTPTPAAPPTQTPVVVDPTGSGNFGDDPPVTRPQRFTCTAATADDPRCRPGRWTVRPNVSETRPVERRPAPARTPTANRQNPIN